MESKRKPLMNEKLLIQFLAEASHLNLPEQWLNTLLVESMDDGAMGSLKLYLPESGNDALFGKQASEGAFFDEDGIKVIATLYLDESGLPFELDIWKTDFSHLIKIPDKYETLN